jgi:hypothetical protein
MGLAPAMQLTAMRTAIAASPAFWVGHETGCNIVTPMLTSQPGLIMAGNFRDADANCYVWMNMEQSAQLTGSEICKTVLHEMGHLNGLQHSTDPTSVMFSPFQADPIPTECQAPVAPATVAKAKASTSRTTICPPGATNADYCQAAPAKRSTRRSHAR